MRFFSGKTKTFIWLIVTVCLIFDLALALNLSPYLRGPAEWPPEWRWQYLFVNTWSRVWLPLFVGSIGLFFLKVKRFSGKKLFVLALWGILLQFSILYFSRAGVGVLIHRIIHPTINGYFTVALEIRDPTTLLHGFEKKVHSFPMHAAGHPPGNIIFFDLILETSKKLTPLLSRLVFSIPKPGTSDVRGLWQELAPYQQLAVFISILAISLISTLTIIPLFHLAKTIYGPSTASFVSLVYLTIPALVSFNPLFDIVFPIFGVLSFLLFLRKWPLVSGIMASIGVFFSLSLLPVIIMLGLWEVLGNRPFLAKIKNLLKFGCGFLLLPLLLLLFFRYDSLGTALVLVSGQAKRDYLLWLGFNLYDFFVFLGLPIAFLFLVKFFSGKRHKQLTVALGLTLALLTVSGFSRAETGRIWLPVMPFVLLEAGSYLKDSRLGYAQVLIFFSVLIQTLVITEFWVTLW